MKTIVCTLLILGFQLAAWCQDKTLEEKLSGVTGSVSAKVGFWATKAGDQGFGGNENEHFPMQSVIKFPVAVAVLAEIDKGTLKLDQKIDIAKKKDLPAKTWSPLRDEHPKGASLTIAEILQYSVSQSDNIACDLLIELIGGPKKVQQFLTDHRFTDMVIELNEADMQRSWEAQFRNWCTPLAMNRFLEATHTNENGLLSETSHAFLWKIMRETTTGPKRLKGLLPADVVVAHKTGSSGTNKGISAATNDVGVIELADGSVVYINVFVTDSREPEEVNERVIAQLAKIAYEYYLAK